MAAEDPAHAAADASVGAFRREVAETYRQAGEDARKALSAYLSRFEERDEEWRARVAAGEAKEGEWRAWRRSQVLAGRRYREVLDQVAAGYTHANEVAMAALSGRLPEVYAENYNYGAYQVESAAGVDTSFCLQDASTVQRLLRDSGSYIPEPRVRVAKDQAWNRRLLSSQLTQGVLLGEPIPKIAARVANVTGSNAAAAVRTARTCVTAAEGAGRVDSYRRAEGMGISLRQEWLATLDGRTRHSHRQMDGERVGVGGTFSNGCRYPGDPSAPYAETMNCRCTLVAAVDGVDQSGARRWSRLPEGMSYEQWRASRPRATGAVPANRTISEFMAMPGTRRKLDAAGVSMTEARRLLTEQLRDYGIPSGSFRKMSAGDQQSTLDGALARIRDAREKVVLDSLGGMPPGLTGSKNTRRMARGIAARLSKCGDNGVRALFKKFGPQLSAIDEKGHIAWFNPNNKRVEMSVAKAMGGDAAHRPYQNVFHEFGHMIDWLSEEGAGYRSTRSGIVEALDRDWKRQRTKALADSYLDSARKNPSAVLRDLRLFGRDAGDDSVVNLAKRFSSKLRNGSVSPDEMLADEGFKSALKRMAEGDLESGGRYNETEADRLIIEKLKSRGALSDMRSFGDLSDIIEGASGVEFPLGLGHGNGYFSGENRDELRATEFFAEVCSAKASNKESLGLIEEFFPGALGEFEKLAKEMAR